MRVVNDKQYFSGRCLCGAVQFELHLNRIKMIYRCYCSLCRKQSGAASNASTVVPTGAFRWQQGEQLIQTYVKETGFTSCFCRQCGSPVPNALGSKPEIMWIPLGLLQEQFTPELELNFCVNSKVSWAEAHEVLRVFDELPDLNELENYFDMNR
ncbi:GFA family protein [Acinetobacter courvalinii]|uniref:GFA family protein n=1 Tax=Acinetobacter courvalinii TaxID=280147 RepID=A0AA42I9H0_9GAMM|nr:GFA family protein [Acinetobacter courvalinii]MDH0564632.1 GFA family protein [Acinetobacter courvalinii]